MRRQKINIGVFKENIQFEPVEVWIRDDSTETKVDIPDIDNLFFIINYGDHGYYRTFIEEQTASFLAKKLSQIPDSLT